MIAFRFQEEKEESVTYWQLAKTKEEINQHIYGLKITKMETKEVQDEILNDLYVILKFLDGDSKAAKKLNISIPVELTVDFEKSLNNYITNL